MMLSRNLNKSCESGVSLVEVVVASLVFMIGIQASLSVMTQSEQARATSGTHSDANMLAKHAADRLIPLSDASCPGNAANSWEALADVKTTNTLACFGLDSATWACEPDYPRSGALTNNDLDLAFGGLGGEGVEVIRTYQDSGSLPEISYDGRRYRVSWNVVCDTPVLHSKTTRIIVGWPPYDTAIAEGRFVALDFIKGDG